MRGSWRVVLSVGVVSALVWSGMAPAEARVNRLHRQAELKLLHLVNRYRAQAEKRKVTEHPVMRREARRHSEHMADEEELSHDGRAGRFIRISKRDDGIRFPRICEVVARASERRDPDVAARRIFRRMKSGSADDRRCLLDRDFTSQKTGIGVDRDGRVWYATVILAHDST